MRPGQNRRVRGRMNRKGPNPLTRSYESNGPDVKIRGTAQHIAEKYTQLARDAQVAGDPVASENYLQHAEHYFRIIAAAHAQLQLAYGPASRGYDEPDDGDVDDDFHESHQPPRAQQGASDEVYPVGAPQPGQAAAGGQRDRTERQDRFEKGQRGERQERPVRGERPATRQAAESGDGRTDVDPRARRERFRRERDVRGVAREAEGEAPDEADVNGFPAFLTKPLRASPAAETVAPEPPVIAVTVESDDGDGVPAEAASSGAAGEEGAERFPVRARRRRGRGRVETSADAAGSEHSAAS